MIRVAVGWAVLTLSGFWAMAIFVAAVVPITILANAGRVVVTGQDSSTLDFQFDREKLNPALDGKLFQFELPAGAVVEEQLN